MESKWAIDKAAPVGFFPKTVLGSASDRFEDVCSTVASFSFPFIAKPDIGGKGRGVAIIDDLSALRQYHKNCPVPFILQEKIKYPLEAGIFYVRMPWEISGRLTGIVEKEFVQVTGNGFFTVQQLLMQNPRYLLQIKALEKIIDPAILSSVLPDGQLRLLVDIGNHARGSHFINASYRINPLITATIDECCRRFPGFYFGRLDIRFNSWEELQQGKHFTVIELNGAGSEPTHIYDPENRIWYAWGEICRHWKWMAEIALYNRKKGAPYLSLKEGTQMFRENFSYNRKMKKFAALAWVTKMS